MRRRPPRSTRTDNSFPTRRSSDLPDFVKSAARDLPDRIVVGVDARGGMVATEGWADVSDVPVHDLARRFEDAGVAALLFTDVGRDGLLKGCNVEATVALARAVEIPVIASGGVAGIQDIHALRGHVADGIEGVITGRATSVEWGKSGAVGVDTGGRPMIKKKN